MIPQLFDRPEFSLSECLCRFLSHEWHFDVLFADSSKKDKFISSETFLYLVVASTWASNQRHLKSQIKHIAFEDIRRPNIQITDSLHDCRHNLEELRTEVAYTKSWIPAIVHEELLEVQKKHGSRRSRPTARSSFASHIRRSRNHREIPHGHLPTVDELNQRSRLPDKH